MGIFALLASEWLLLKSAPRWHAVALIGVNAILSQWGLVGLLALTPAEQARLLLICLFLVVVVVAALRYRGQSSCVVGFVAARRQRHLVYAAIAMAMAVLVAIVLMSSGYVQIGKLVGATATFVAANFVDAVRHVPHSELQFGTYARNLAWSLAIFVPLYPLLAVAVTPLLLFFIDIVESLGLHTKATDGALNELVFDCVFYSPFVTVFILTKRRCLKDADVQGTPLPVKAPKKKASKTLKGAER